MKYFFYTHVHAGMGKHTLPGPHAFVTSIWQPQLTTDCSQSLALSLGVLLSQKEIRPIQRLLWGLTKIRFNEVPDTTSDTVLNHSLSFQIQCSVWWSAYQWREPQAHKGKPASLEKAVIPTSVNWFTFRLYTALRTAWNGPMESKAEISGKVKRPEKRFKEENAEQKQLWGSMERKRKWVSGVRADMMMEENEALNPSMGLTWVQETV